MKLKPKFFKVLIALTLGLAVNVAVPTSSEADTPSNSPVDQFEKQVGPAFLQNQDKLMQFKGWILDHESAFEASTSSR